MSRIFNKSLTAFLVAAIGLLSLASCVREQQPDNREKDYGYVQFKLYKEASYGAATKSVVSQLEYLSQAAKIKVNLVFGNGTISQTMTLGAADSEAAEFGMRSEKLQLLSGSYEVDSFVLFDKLVK